MPTPIRPMRLPGYRNGFKRTIRNSLKATQLRYSFNLSEDQYYDLLEKQDHRCAICHTHVNYLTRELAVDHDHGCCPTLPVQCGGTCVRGLLCVNCNIGIGNFRDEEWLLESAIEYLRCYKTGVNPV